MIEKKYLHSIRNENVFVLKSFKLQIVEKESNSNFDYMSN